MVMVMVTETVWPSGKAGKRKDLGSIPLRLSFLFKKVVVQLWTLSCDFVHHFLLRHKKMALIAAHLNAGHSGADSEAIGIYSHSSPRPPPYLLPRFSPSLISLVVYVDVKHYVYLL